MIKFLLYLNILLCKCLFNDDTISLYNSKKAGTTDKGFLEIYKNIKDPEKLKTFQ